MSETQKSTMGPRRLFLLLALAAVAYWYFSDLGNTTETVDIESDDTEMTNNNSDLIDIQTELEGTHITPPLSNTEKKLQSDDSSDVEYNPNHSLDYEPNHTLDYSPGS
tara:strand:+ start:426 stop:749 length:324 start_codon:yes stop_codon:yes gene_type:complete